jgi:SulP family sulfate permease
MTVSGSRGIWLATVWPATKLTFDAVGIVALPLSMALAIAVGVPPQHGLYTAIVAGGLVAALGGSRTQVTGPTAAFIVILAPIYTRFGLAGLLMAGLLGGLLLIGMGIGRLGQFIEYIPHPVTTGFTAGIATVIATLQLKDLFGLKLATTPEHYFASKAQLFLNLRQGGCAVLNAADHLTGAAEQGYPLFFARAGVDTVMCQTPMVRTTRKRALPLCICS